MISLTCLDIVDKLIELNKVEEELKQIVKQVQLNCLHDRIAEYASNYGGSPVRICLHCGLTEEGWGYGYMFLKNKTELSIPFINSKNFHILRQGIYISNDIKGQLLREEVTLDVL